MSSLRLRSSSGLRLALAAALSVGAVAVVLLIASGHASRRSAQTVSGNQSHIQPVDSPKGDAAVTRSLRRGVMVVAIDQPSSGSFTEQNASIAQGATVAVNELNATGGLSDRHIRIKLVPQDLESLSPAAVERKLHSEAAAVVILPCDTDLQPSLAAAAARRGTLMLAPCNPEPSAGRLDSSYWPVGMKPSDEAAGLAGFMHTVGYGSVFIVNASGNRYAELMTGYFMAAARRKGIRIVGSASVGPTMGGLSGLAQAIASANPRPSTIFTALAPPLVNQLAAGLQARGVKQNVAGTSALDTRLTLTSNVGALEDAVFPSYGFPRESAAARRFADDYKRLFGAAPVGSFPGLGFETIRLLETAVRQARSAEPSAIQRALSRGLVLAGVALAERSYQPGGDHNPTGTVAIEKIVSGHFEPVFAATP